MRSTPPSRSARTWANSKPSCRSTRPARSSATNPTTPGATTCKRVSFREYRPFRKGFAPSDRSLHDRPPPPPKVREDEKKTTHPPRVLPRLRRGRWVSPKGESRRGPPQTHKQPNQPPAPSDRSLHDRPPPPPKVREDEEKRPQPRRNEPPPTSSPGSAGGGGSRRKARAGGGHPQEGSAHSDRSLYDPPPPHHR